jgi:GLPGLI family protein
MKFKIFLLFIIFVSFLSAQDFQGIATYKTKQALDIKLDSTQLGGMQDEVMAVLRKQFEKTYLLTFDQQYSVYTEDEALTPPSVGAGVVFVMSDSGSDLLYKDIKEQRYVKQSELLGKLFLIKDSIKKNNWQLHSDTKNIGTYSCYKATLERTVNRFFSDESKKETQIITAWYAPQIPVSNGPEEFQGLPGLILELSSDTKTILCSRVVLNPKKKITIEPPTKGKMVSQLEFNAISEKKLKEMTFKTDISGSRGSIEIEIED